MKTKWTTYLLMTAVVAIWSVVAWKIFAPACPDAPVTELRTAVPKRRETVPDTLRTDYPDPFLKDISPNVKSGPRYIRPFPISKSHLGREHVKITHLGTVSSGNRMYFILLIGGRQYELALRERADGFELANFDHDSIFLRKAGICYGVKRCLP